MKNAAIFGLAILIAALMTVGCEDDRDERLVAVATEAVRQQADQNRRMIDLQEKVATGSRDLVQADSKARREMIELHDKVVRQQSEVGRQRDRLDEERKALGAERRRETVWAAVIHDGVSALACLLPLVLAVLALWPRPENPQTVELSELLLVDLAAEHPLLAAPASRQALPPPTDPSSRPRLEAEPPPASDA